MKNQVLLLGILGVSAVFAAGSSRAATILSQNFDNDPVNYTLPPGSEFRFQASEPTRYWGTSDMGMSLNPNIVGNTGNYLAGQNMDADGDGTLTFSAAAPAQIDFSVNATGISSLQLSIDLAGLPGADPGNYIRAFTDDDGDGIYETPVFNFEGPGDGAYNDPTYGMLSGTFTTIPNIALDVPTALDGMLRLRIEVFNDTNRIETVPEAVGLDNIQIQDVPEPSSVAVLGGAIAMLGIARRRR